MSGKAPAAVDMRAESPHLNTLSWLNVLSC